MKLRTIFIAFFVFVYQGTAFGGGTTYSKTATLPPIRITYPELQTILNKANSLTEAANVGKADSFLREKARLEVGDVRLEFTGHTIPINEAKIPKIAFQFSYNRYATLETMPISAVSLEFNDRERQLVVAGSSPEHVDALFDTLRSDLLELASPIGGWDIRFWFKLVSTFVLGMIFIRGLEKALKPKGARVKGVLVFSALSLILVHTLPFHEILAGFSVSLGDSMFISRYGPHISFIGFLISVLGIPLSYYLPLRFGKTKQPSENLSHHKVAKGKRR